MNVNKIITQKIIDRLQEAERTGEKFYWVNLPTKFPILLMSTSISTIISAFS